MYRISFLLLLSALVQSCKNGDITTLPVLETITESVYASGTIKAKNQYQVYASVTGLVQQIYVADGDTVRKGSPLFSILNETSRLTRENAQLAAELTDLRANQVKLDELLLQIELARSKMMNDSLLYIRQESLWAENIGSKNDLERSQLNYQNTRTAYASLQLRYRDEKRRLDLLSRQALKNVEISRNTEGDFLVRSIMDGRVYSVLREPGEMVSPQNPLAVIGDASLFILELEVDEYDITAVKEGQSVKVSMDSYKGQVFDAIITRINPILNPRTKTATVEATFTTPPPQLYPNLSLEANIIIRVKENVMTIPRKFLFQENFVLLENGDTIQVRIGLRDYQKVEILEGLTEQDVLMLPSP